MYFYCPFASARQRGGCIKQISGVFLSLSFASLAGWLRELGGWHSRVTEGSALAWVTCRGAGVQQARAPPINTSLPTDVRGQRRRSIKQRHTGPSADKAHPDRPLLLAGGDCPSRRSNPGEGHNWPLENYSKTAPKMLQTTAASIAQKFKFDYIFLKNLQSAFFELLDNAFL